MDAATYFRHNSPQTGLARLHLSVATNKIPLVTSEEKFILSAATEQADASLPLLRMSTCGSEAGDLSSAVLVSLQKKTLLILQEAML